MEAAMKRNGRRMETSTKTIILLGILLIAVSSAPIFSPYLYDAHDLNFHLCRIEAIKHALLNEGGG